MCLVSGQRVLARYIAESLVGKGGMGLVYRGRHERLGFPVAIKVLTAREPEALARFEREAKLMARIRHPNVVSVFDCGVLDDGRPCIVMEFVEGESLESRVRSRGSLPWRDSAALTLGILKGIEVIHAASILHRDLKPSNVLIASGVQETVKLIDFCVRNGDCPHCDHIVAWTNCTASIGRATPPVAT